MPFLFRPQEDGGESQRGPLLWLAGLCNMVSADRSLPRAWAAAGSLQAHLIRLLLPLLPVT